MTNYSGNSLHNNGQTANHVRERNGRKCSGSSSGGSGSSGSAFLRVSLRGYGFCMGTLFVFCLGSLLYQLNGGPPQILLDIRQYLGESTFQDDHKFLAPRVLTFPSQVVYNRVGKCGSRTVVMLLKLLAEKHHFNLVSSEIHNKTRLSKHEQVSLMKNITSIPEPFLFTRHVHFLNFTSFKIEQPVYFNIIRDPINRFLSNYFFRRFGDFRGEQFHLLRTPNMKDEERYLDINVCILENYPECSNPRIFYIIPYFCGQHPKCREPGVWALEKAKQNVMENYLLVGILEELEDVLLLLERLLPQYFSGAVDIYKGPDYMKMGKLTSTVRKYTPTLEALQVLYHRMSFEYEFYNFIRDQFHLLKRKIGLKSEARPPAYSPEFLHELAVRTPEPLDEDEELDNALEDANSWPIQM
uniref:Uronyl 2-sulfotransferase n=1 Tax=Knipowitschia caucasica TaxID=637954 RepID=A0AAV2KG76_KNICA